MSEDLPVEAPVQPAVLSWPDPGASRDAPGHHGRMRSSELFQDVIGLELPGRAGSHPSLRLRDHLVVAGGLIPLLPNQDGRVLDIAVMKDPGARLRQPPPGPVLQVSLLRIINAPEPAGIANGAEPPIVAYEADLPVVGPGIVDQ